LAHAGREEVAKPIFESPPGMEYKLREDGIQSRKFEFETSMELKPSRLHSWFFCPSRESRDEASLSESVPTGLPDLPT